MVKENMSSKPKASKSQTKLGPIKTPLVKTPPKIEEQITDKTKVITWADINGQAPDLDKIVAIAKKHNLLTIQDAAPSAGSKYKNKRIGHKDHKIDMTCFSFGPVKNFGAIGGAGAITGAKEYVEQATQDSATDEERRQILNETLQKLSNKKRVNR